MLAPGCLFGADLRTCMRIVCNVLQIFCGARADRLEGLRSFQDAAVRRLRNDPTATDTDRATVRSGLKVQNVCLLAIAVHVFARSAK